MLLIWLSFARYWYLVEYLSLYTTLYLSVALTLEAGGAEKQWFARPLCWASCLLPCVEILLYLLAPVWGSAVTLHGLLQNLYRLFIIVCLLSGGVALGLGLNLLDANLFEPICTLLQFEWSGLFMVLLFGAMMVAQNRAVIEENRTYQAHLEELVQQRIGQLSCLLDERRTFFSDMAHDLESPLAATGAFIELIRANSVELDNKLQFYLEQVERQRQEITRRVSSLGELNAVDRLTAQSETLTVNELLQKLYHIHSPEALVSGVHLILRPPRNPCPSGFSTKSCCWPLKT